MCLARLRQVLDDVEQGDDVRMTDAPQVRRVRDPLQDVQAGAPAIVGSLRCELDPRDVEVPRGLHEKEAVGASQFQQLAALAIAANEIDAAGKLAAQYRLGAEVIGVAVQAPAGNIILGVVGGGIERGRLRAAEAAFAALPDVASVDAEAKRMRRRAAGRTRPRELALHSRDGVCLQGARSLLQRYIEMMRARGRRRYSVPRTYLTIADCGRSDI